MLLRALEIEPVNLQNLNASAEFYLKRQRYREAKKIAERMVAAHPLNTRGRDLLESINRKLEAGDR